MKNRKNRRRRHAELLGMSFEVATKKLHRSLLFQLLRELELNVCDACGQDIHSASDLSLHHVIPWEDNPTLFWDLNNVRPRCIQCPVQQEKKIMQTLATSHLIEVTLIGENGKTLPAYDHEASRYFAGQPGKRYTVRIKNKSSARIEVVTTVDGLNVIDGEAGNYKTQTGYVLGAYDHVDIDGFRQNLNEVAAFRFTDEDEDPTENSYAGLKGQPENLGVISVAVFHERPRIHTLKARGQRPSGDMWFNIMRNSNSIPKGLISTESYGCSTSCNAGAEPELLAGNSAPVESDLGTEYGETIHSSVRQVSFFRAMPETPDDLVRIEYATEANLKHRGIIIEKPVAPKRDGWPGVDNVMPGFAAPPPNKK